MSTCLDGFERGRPAVFLPGRTDCVSTWSGTGCRLPSFLSVCEILATVASVPVHLSCFGCYCRDQDKQKISSRQTWDQRIVQASVLGYQWYQLCTMKSPPLVNLRDRDQGNREAEMQRNSTCLRRSETRKACPLDYISQMCCDITWM